MGQQRGCDVCGRPLSRYNGGNRCHSCARDSEQDTTLRVPAELHERPDIRHALAAGDWPVVLAAVMQTTNATQTDIAALTGVSQPHISRLANGHSRDPGIRTVRALCDGLGIPRRLAGLADLQETETDRRHFIADGLAAAGAAALVPLPAPRTPDHDDQMLMLSVAAYRRIEQHTPARMLTAPVVAHLNLARQLADRAADASLHAVVSEAAGLAAWLHADLDEPANTRRFYQMSVQAARRSGHPLLPVYMQASLGQYATASGDPLIGLRLIRDASARLPRSAPTIARAWLEVLEGLALAYLGDRTGLPLFDRAEQRMTTALDDEPVWPWLFRFDPPKIAAYRATAASRLGLVKVAETAFRIAATVTRSPKQRAVAAVDHAHVLASANRLDEACELACKALDLGQRLGSERTTRAVRAFRTHLGARAGRMTEQLDERLAAAYTNSP